MKDKEFRRFGDLQVSEDGEVFVPESGSHPAHYTYGCKMSSGYRAVQYKESGI